MKELHLSDKFSLEDIREIRNHSAKQYETMPIEQIVENTRRDAQRVLEEINKLPVNPQKSIPPLFPHPVIDKNRKVN